MTFDVITLGEAMIRLSVPPGSHLETTPHMAVDVAGSEVNTAVALAQLDRHVAWLSRLPNTPLGRRVIRDLRGHAVDVSMVETVSAGRLGLYYVELAQPPHVPRIIYDRTQSTATEMFESGLPEGLADSTRLVHITGITPALSVNCHRVVASLARQAREGRCLLSVDINYRAKLWTPSQARACMDELCRRADLVLVTREDARDLFGFEGEPVDVAQALHRRMEAAAVVLTLGPEGSVWASADESGYVPAIPTTLLDRPGAGDAFAAGVIDGLLNGDLAEGVDTGVRLASLALATSGDQVVINPADLQRPRGQARSIDR